MPATRMPSSTVSEMLESLKAFDPQRLTQEVTEIGEKWADHDAAANSFEETRKSMLAKLSLEYQANSLVSPDGKHQRPISSIQAEQCARADERYAAHLDLMVEARKQANISRVRYDMGKMRLELMRSLQATVRQEMNMVSGR